MPNVRIYTPVEKIFIKDLVMADRTLLRPSNSNPLVEGEFLELDANYKAIRSGGDALSFMFWAEKGRSDTQAIGKVPTLYMGGYEADTIVYDSTALGLGNALMVDDVSFESLTRSGLKKHGGGDELVIGYVTRVLSDRVRFMQVLV